MAKQREMIDGQAARVAEDLATRLRALDALLDQLTAMDGNRHLLLIAAEVGQLCGEAACVANVLERRVREEAALEDLEFKLEDTER